MKKILYIFIITTFVVGGIKAQTTEFDALNLAQSEIRGTARYMGMAGAFGALGGDVSAVKDNAAGLGIYRSSEILLTYSLLDQNSKSLFQDIGTRDRLQKFSYNNFAYTWSHQTGNSRGLLFSNFSFSHNRTKNFNRKANVRGASMYNSIMDQILFMTNEALIKENDLKDADHNFNAPGDPSFLSIMAYKDGLMSYDTEDGKWKAHALGKKHTDFRYLINESGYIGESSLSWGGNINNTLYLGASLNLKSVNYLKSEVYMESSKPDFNFKLANNLSTTGMGINLNLGIIYRPIDPLRIGLSYTTITNYQLEDETYNVYLNSVDAPRDFYNYGLRTPSKLNASVAYVFGKRLIVSSEFIYSPQNQTTILANPNFINDYAYENNIIDKFNSEITIKTGLELRLTDYLYARAGFAHIGFSNATTAMQDDARKLPWLGTARTDFSYSVRKSNQYYSAGIGYRGNFWAFDFACVKRDFEENFTPHEASPISGTIKTKNLDFIGTLAFRF